MSGGSYDYLFLAADMGTLGEHRDQLVAALAAYEKGRGDGARS